MAGQGGGAHLSLAHLSLDRPSWTVTISDSHIWRNVATSEGGGLFLVGSRSSESVGQRGGGGDDSVGGSLRRCIVDGNVAWVAADNLRISKASQGCGAQGGGCAVGAGNHQGSAWRIDEQTTVSRLACATAAAAAGAAPSCLRFAQPPEPSPRIFVSVVSFRDAECARTLLDLFSSAERPERVNVGLVEQHNLADGGDGDCLYLLALHAPEFLAQIRRVIVRPEEARGPVVARNLSRALHRGEHYFLSVDSHMRFACDWDTKLVSLHLSLNQSRAIITAYPPNYEPLGSLRHAKALVPSRLAALDFNEDGVLRIGSVYLSDAECGCSCAAAQSLFWAAGFNFGRALSLSEVTYDARLIDLFWGEELLMALLLWTAGYDFYAPCDASLVLHRWSRGYRQTFWQQRNTTGTPAATSELLLRLLLNPRAGHKRRGAEYEQYANISIRYAAAGHRALAGLPPKMESIS